MIDERDFSTIFEALTGNPPFPWQTDLYENWFMHGKTPDVCDIPTGLGKTSVIALWLIARANGAKLSRRLVYVVDRRAVVDQATREAVKLRSWVDNNPDVKEQLELPQGQSLPISTLRGQYVDNREWLEDPSASAIIVGTVDMIGSRLLFEGYGVSRKMRPYHAALLGADTLLVLDEAHLVPPFEMMLRTLVSDDAGLREEEACAGLVPKFNLLSLSATGRTVDGAIVRLTDADLKHPEAKKRLEATKRLSFRESDGSRILAELLAEEAWNLAGHGRNNVRIIVYSNSRDDAEKSQQAIKNHAKGDKKQGIEQVHIETQLFVGARRVRERENAAEWLGKHGFLAGSDELLDKPAFVFATSAGEVGIDLDADHMVCDLVAWERMVQRLGRVNRRGNGAASVRVVIESPQPDKKTQDAIRKSEIDRTNAEQKRVDDFQAANERVEVFKRPILELPKQDGCHDTSPGAIRKLKLKAENDKGLAEIIAAATSPPPLRPALTRPIVDAWSMTSLEKHTGRPLVAPWLRGWVDDEPQTTIVWRRYLPDCRGIQATEKQQKANAKEFFEYAPPHLSETLETESYRVLDWLTKRAKMLLKITNEESQVSEATDGKASLKPDSIVGIILGRALDVVRIFTLRELDFDGDDKKVNKRRKENLERDLRNNALVLDRRFGGLTKDGLMNSGTKDMLEEAGDDEDWDLTDFRVSETDDGGKSIDSDWRTCFRFVTRVSEEGEPESYLVVDRWRHTPASEDSRSISRTVQELAKHQEWAEREAGRLATRIGLSDEHARMLRIVARLHDEGKRTERWQRAFNAPLNGTAYAKTQGPVKFNLLDGYRHEFGSLPMVEADPEFQSLAPDLQELALHLVAAHHGFARPIIRTNSCDDSPPSALEVRARDVALRFARLQQRWGPWGLAWWESLLRAADQRASRALDESVRETKQEKQEEVNHG